MSAFKCTGKQNYCLSKWMLIMYCQSSTTNQPKSMCQHQINLSVRVLKQCSYILPLCKPPRTQFHPLQAKVIPSTHRLSTNLGRRNSLQCKIYRCTSTKSDSHDKYLKVTLIKIKLISISVEWGCIPLHHRVINHIPDIWHFFYTCKIFGE